MHIILVKKKQSVKQRNRPISGPIRSDPVIRPDPVNTRTLCKVHCPSDGDVNWMSPVQGKSPPLQAKEPYSNLDMVYILVCFHPSDGDVNWKSPVQGKSPPVQVKAQELEVWSLYHLYSLKTKGSRCH